MKPLKLEPWPYFEDDEIQAVTDVLRSGKVNYWTGKEGQEFEKEFADFTGCKHAIAVANGTLALELALEALDIQPGDEVVVASCTFIATASSVVARGATPVCADIEPYSQNISADTIRPCITPKTKAIICVHLGGLPCDMDPILALAKEHHLYVVEDCAQAIGATYKGKKVGSLGHINTFSFCQDKIMTTGGEGGMVTTNDDALWKRAWEYKDHGKSYDKVYHMEHPPGFRWLHDRFGSNFRLTDMQSAMGRVQLRKIDRWIEARKANARHLDEVFASIDYLIRPEVPDTMTHAWYKYYVFVDPDKVPEGWTRDRIMTTLNEHGVPCFSGACCEIYREKAFEHLPDHSKRHPTAKIMDETSLMLLIHPTLSKHSIEQMCATIQLALKAVQ